MCIQPTMELFNTMEELWRLEGNTPLLLRQLAIGPIDLDATQRGLI